MMVALAVLGLVLGFWARQVLMDDAMITFRVAENLAYGRGFVYNPGERVQVTTTPLYTILLVPGIWLLGSAPRAALALNLALAALIPVLAYDAGRRMAGWLTGLTGALLLAASPFLVLAFSMEGYLYVALILASFDAYLARRNLLAGVLVGLTALVRGDGALLAASLAGYDLLAHRRLRWRLILPAAAIPALWYLFALVYFGSPFPATLAAKTAQGEFNWLRRNFLEGAADFIDHWTRNRDTRLYWLFPGFLVIGLLRAVWKERRWFILVGQAALYTAAFTALKVPAAEWYYAAVMPAAALLTACGIQTAADLLARPASTRLRPYLSAAAGLLATLPLLALMLPATAMVIAGHPDWKARAYPPVARWVASHTSPAATLATIDIGHIGYWSRRHIIDIVGLAQPDVAPAIARGDFGYAIRHYQPDLILLGYLWLSEVQQSDWFRAAYAPRQLFKGEGMDQPLVLFSKRQGVKVQPDLPPDAEVTPLAVDFNRQARLTGYHLTGPLRPGQTARLTLVWQVDAPLAVDFTVFVQLVDGQNRIVAQGDGKPQNGFYPTTFWQAGETVIDAHTLNLPADLPPGRYSLLVGLYEAGSGARLQILDETGKFKSDHVRIEGVVVQAP
ncbi:MAG: hypothetical protein D6784_17545 [Chloroflexi bacterium]|nr:MAG: hypothetical protein D6784_17545 [Chloroflexota bacterium]